LPEIENYLHYRSIDVSTLKELALRWAPAVVDAAPKKATTHRALDDIRESVAELRWYREHLFRPTADASDTAAPTSA
ncbi:MAG: exonuclease domain-containing protein, partial [Acidimicrobiales bacterium]